MKAFNETTLQALPFTWGYNAWHSKAVTISTERHHKDMRHLAIRSLVLKIQTKITLQKIEILFVWGTAFPQQQPRATLALNIHRTTAKLLGKALMQLLNEINK